MKKKTAKPLFAAIALSAGLLSATTANAALISALGGKVVNDTDLNITWLADANYAKTSGYDADGMMTWSQAQTWITSLNDAYHLGYNDWRLPTTLQPDASCVYQSGGVSYGYNCTGSEMGHLFYNELGGVAGSSILSSSDPDLALFQNVQPLYYWSGTEYAPNPSLAWGFYTFGGSQFESYKYGDMSALAVRPGQVAAVPEPATTWLLGLGLLGLAGVGRRRLALR